MNWWVIIVETCLNSIHKCLYVNGVLIGVVVCGVWMKMRKYELLVKNELDDNFDMNWCYDSTFVLIVFWCMLTNKQIWVKGEQNRGFWWKLELPRGSQNLGSLVPVNSLSEWLLAMASCSVQQLMFWVFRVLRGWSGLS